MSATEASGSFVRNIAAAVCPAGKDVIGAYAEVGGGGGDFVAVHAVGRQIAGASRPATATAGAHEHTATDANWTLTVTAVCARVG